MSVVYPLMQALQGCYVLVLDNQSEDVEQLRYLLGRLRCACVVMNTAEQLVDIATKAVPYLVIVGGDQHTWSPKLVEQLRQVRQAKGAYRPTILALTDCHEPSWLPQEENPGFDGFLVKPLNGDVLSSVVESARVRRNYFIQPEAV